MAAVTGTNIEDAGSSNSVIVESATMKTMVQSASKCKGKVECSIVTTFPDVKPWKPLKPAERTKFRNISKEKSRKLRDCCKFEGNACKSPSPCIGLEERKAEVNGLHLSPVIDIKARESSLLPDSIPSICNSEYHVLVVDDSTTERNIVARFLKASSYKVKTVDSASGALEYLGLSETCSTLVNPNRATVHLIVTDYCMPGMTGYQLLKIVKADTSVFKDIPVIVMSSEEDPDRISRCLAEGAKEFIIKPVKMEDVKRLRGHIQSSAISSSESNEILNSSAGTKRKSPDDLQLCNPERRPRTVE